jgi:hypothetical protein
MPDEDGNLEEVSPYILPQYSKQIQSAIEADQKRDIDTMAMYFWTHDQKVNDSIRSKLLTCKWGLASIGPSLYGQVEVTATESFTEKEKGEASDSFKRAGFNWGIGRELYTAPFIWITTTSDDLDNRGKIKTKFFVREIDYNEQNEINHLVIVDGKGNARFTFGKVKGDSGKVKAADKQEVTLEEAIAEMYACETLDAVKACWSKYPQFKSNEIFKQACTEQGFKTQNK